MQSVGRRNDKRSHSLISWFGVGAMALASLAMIHDASARGRTGSVNVDCDAGDSLQTELDKGFNGMRFNVTGECVESIIVRLDDIHIDGKTLDPSRRGTITSMSVAGIPGLVQIRSSSVLITNMTIGPSNSRGVVVQLGGSIIFKKNIVDDHDKAGIVITSGGYGLIGPTSSDDHITPPNTGGLGTGTGNVISRTDIGIVVRLSAGAAIFHNAIYDNDRYGISVSAGGSADIDSNLITGHKGLPDATDPPATEEDGRGITMTTNAAVRLDEQVFHGGLDDDPSGIGNVITGNDIGLRCSLGGAINGDKPDFGGVTGNSKYGWLIFGSCAKSSSVWGGSGTQMGP